MRSGRSLSLECAFGLIAVVAVVGLTTTVTQPAAAVTRGDSTDVVGWTSVSPGEGGQTCGVRTDGTLWCWGHNGQGQLGDGTTTNRSTPRRIGNRADWSSVAPGLTHTCATRTDGTAWCWGFNSQGELGDGTTTQRLRPVQVAGASGWTAVSAGSTHTCGLRGDGVAWCWGSEGFGKLGNDKHGRRFSATPVKVHSNAHWVSLNAGDEHSCAIREDHSAWCWGSNVNGQLGIGSAGRRTSRDIPVRAGSASDWTVLRAGYEATCGIRSGGTAWCWGDNSSGQVGDGTTTLRRIPTPVGTRSDWAAVEPGGSHTCGVRTAGTAWCWGSNDHGQIGNGSLSSSATPTRVGSATTWVSVSAGGNIYQNHTCGTRSTGVAWCWGDNVNGQVGDGTNKDRLAPVRLQ